MGVLGFLRLGQRKGVTSKGDQAEDDDLDDEFVLGPLPPRALEPLQPRAPRSTRRPKLTDDDREVFQYARNLTLRNVWRVQWSGWGGAGGTGGVAAGRAGRRGAWGRVWARGRAFGRAIRRLAR